MRYLDNLYHMDPSPFIAHATAEFHDEGCYTWCDLKPYLKFGNYNQVVCYPRGVVLFGTDYGNVKSAYLFDSNNHLFYFLI